MRFEATGGKDGKIANRTTVSLNFIKFILKEEH